MLSRVVPRHVVNHHALFAENTVSKRRLTHVWATHDSQLDRQILRVEVVFRLFLSFFSGFKLRPVFSVLIHLFRWVYFINPRQQNGFQQAGDATAMRGRDRINIARGLKTRNPQWPDRHRCRQFCSPPGKVGFSRERRCLAIAESAGIRPARASTINRTTSASSIASRDCSAMRVSTPSSVPSIPPVSIQMNSRPSTSARPYLRSRVSPGNPQPAHHGCVLNG